MRERQRLAIHVRFSEVFRSRARDRDGAPTLRRTSRERGDRIRRLGDANERVMFSARALRATEAPPFARPPSSPSSSSSPSPSSLSRSKLEARRYPTRASRARSNVRARECGAEREISTRVAFASSRRRRVARVSTSLFGVVARRRIANVVDASEGHGVES